MEQDNHAHLDDQELLSRFYADGNNKWLGILLPRYSLLLFGVCMKYLKNEEDARDCVQQVFLKVIDQLHKYDVNHFKSWIYMVAKNHCLMRLRDQKHYNVEWTENIHPSEEEMEKRLRNEHNERLFDLLHENIAKLKPEQQICIRYFYLEKKSYAEIAEITDFTMAQVKSYLQNGKRNLEMLMRQHYPKNV